MRSISARPATCRRCSRRRPAATSSMSQRARAAIDGSAILVKQDSPIQTLADLKGKKVAFKRGSSAHNFAVKALRTAGLTLDDIDATRPRAAGCGAGLCQQPASTPGSSGTRTIAIAAAGARHARAGDDRGDRRLLGLLPGQWRLRQGEPEHRRRSDRRAGQGRHGGAGQSRRHRRRDLRDHRRARADPEDRARPARAPTSATSMPLDETSSPTSRRSPTSSSGSGSSRRSSTIARHLLVRARTSDARAEHDDPAVADLPKQAALAAAGQTFARPDAWRRFGPGSAARCRCLLPVAVIVALADWPRACGLIGNRLMPAPLDVALAFWDKAASGELGDQHRGQRAAARVSRSARRRLDRLPARARQRRLAALATR